jgi:hypothetical protein
MNWYAASVVILFEYEDGDQNDFPVWENIYLIEAADDQTAMDKAVQYGKKDEGNDNGSLMVNGRKARRVFKGIRKLVSVVNLNANDDVPSDGAEITFSDFLLKSESDLNSLVDGDYVDLRYVE